MKAPLEWLKEYVDVDCSAEELAERLTKSGLSLEELIGEGDQAVLDVEVTSNRPDCLGVIGLAREAAAVLGRTLRLPQIELKESPAEAARLCSVRVDDPDLCPRYTARVIEGVKIGPSPAWLVGRLEAVGVRSVNNVVDVTNYVMFEIGQPLHAFDCAKLAEHRIIVRRARGGETIVAIDGSQHELSDRNLIIADARRPVAVAGVMGGLETEVSATTTTVLLESAEFDPLCVRRTARQLNLHSESSYRFERGVDPVATEWASRRAARLIVETAGGQIARGMVDVWAEPFKPAQLTLPMALIQRILGIEAPRAAVQQILTSLGFAVEPAKGGFAVEVPPHRRRDVTRPIDLVEEVGRIWGYDKVPMRETIRIAAQRRSRQEIVTDLVSDGLNQAGFNEAMTVSLVSPETAGLFTEVETDRMLTVADHQRRADNVLRCTLAPSLLESSRLNQNVGNRLCELYEIARVYPPPQDGGLPKERIHLAMVSMRELRVVSGALEHVADLLGRPGELRLKPVPLKWFLPDQSAEVWLGEVRLGIAGSISPAIRKQFDLRKPVCVAEIDFKLLLELPRTTPVYQPLAKYPAIERDLSIVVDEPITWDRIERTIHELHIEELQTIRFNELFRGKQVAPGKKSIFLTLEFRHPERSLTHEQVDQYQQAITEALQNRCKAVLRAS